MKKRSTDFPNPTAPGAVFVHDDCIWINEGTWCFRTAWLRPNQASDAYDMVTQPSEFGMQRVIGANMLISDARRALHSEARRISKNRK